jgi:predicted nucleic acid-binding protein
VPREPAVQAVADADWLEVLNVPPPIPEAIRAWDLGAGESAVLAWARRNAGALTVMDDLQGRRCAASLGVPVMGTLAIVLAAKRLGRLGSIRGVLAQAGE